MKPSTQDDNFSTGRVANYYVVLERCNYDNDPRISSSFSYMPIIRPIMMFNQGKEVIYGSTISIFGFLHTEKCEQDE